MKGDLTKGVFFKQTSDNNWQQTVFAILTLGRFFFFFILWLSLRDNPGKDFVLLSNYGKK